MGTTNIYRARVEVCTASNKIELMTCSQDSNVRQIGGSIKEDARNGWFETWKSLPLDDPEQIACTVESMAHGYDGCSYLEPGRLLTGPLAYRLWRGRIKRAGGPAIRKPRLSKVCYEGVPQGFFFGSVRPGYDASLINCKPSSRKSDRKDYPFGDPIAYRLGVFVVFNESCQFVFARDGSQADAEISEPSESFEDERVDSVVSFSENCARAMVDRLREFVPEYDWRVLPTDEYLVFRGLTE